MKRANLIRYTFVLALLISVQGVMDAQGTNSLIHLDKPYYASGETVKYKLYLPTQFLELEALLESKMFDRNGKLVDRSYLHKNKDLHVNGYFTVPFDAPTGYYGLVISSLNEKTGQEVVMGSTSIPIYNDLTNINSELTPDSVLKTVALPKPDLSLKIHLDQQTVQPGGMVSFDLTVYDDDGSPVEASVSIAVTDIGLIGTRAAHSYSTINEMPLTVDQNSSLSKYIAFSGHLDDKVEGQLLTFYMPSEMKMYYTTSLEDGNFRLMIPEFYGVQQLQYVGAFSKNIQMTPHDSEIEPNISMPPVTQTIANYLDNSAKRKLIFQLYNRVEGVANGSVRDSLISTVPDRTINTSDYPFELLTEFCREISTPLKYAKTGKNSFEFKMFNPESRNFYFGNPLFIIDRQLTRDFDFLSNLQFQELERIDLYYNNQQLSNNFGFAGFSGVVIITSKTGKMQVPDNLSTQEFSMRGVQPVLEIDSAETADGMPALKPQLIWEPSLRTSSNGTLSYSYIQSDDVSLFQIEIVAQGVNGERGYAVIEYPSVR